MIKVKKNHVVFILHLKLK